jgi:hypothetical protein
MSVRTFRVKVRPAPELDNSDRMSERALWDWPSRADEWRTRLTAPEVLGIFFQFGMFGVSSLVERPLDATRYEAAKSLNAVCRLLGRGHLTS